LSYCWMLLIQRVTCPFMPLRDASFVGVVILLVFERERD
jgi:hypothetical protein